ncbi:MAG: GAF domain-containing protein, partial [Anaerolineaceae bacterium]|nr:GAF domain-containing protein [Anaerolineaceae bacterium]
MDRKIILVGQDRVKNARISTLLERCEISDFELAHFFSINKAKNALMESGACLVLIQMNSEERVNAFLGYLRKSYSHIPVILITTADYNVTRTLMKKGVHFIISPDAVDEISLMRVILVAIERKQIENELHMRDEIMQAVNYAAEVFLSQMNWESRIDEVLARLGRATQSDRVYIYKNEMQEEVGLVPKLQVEWTTEGVQPLKGFPEAIENEYQTAGFQRWMDVFKNQEIICGNVLELPSVEQAHLLKLDVQSLVVVPIFTDNLLWGFIGYDQCRFFKKWSSIE